MGIVEFSKPKPRRSSARALPLEQATGAGRRQLTRIEGELIRAFAGAATTLRYLNAQVALGETGEIDLSGYATNCQHRVAHRQQARPVETCVHPDDSDDSEWRLINQKILETFQLLFD